MKILVKVTANSRRPGIHHLADGSLWVKVSVPPVKGLANEVVRRYLASHFGLPLKSVIIKVGQQSKYKIVELEGYEQPQ